jgi:conjugal transfer pilus assembly protein TrbC
MRFAAWGIAALLATAGVSALLAQTVDGLDVQAIKSARPTSPRMPKPS